MLARKHIQTLAVCLVTVLVGCATGRNGDVSPGDFVLLSDGTKIGVFGQLYSRDQPAPWKLLLSRYVIEPLAPSIWTTPLAFIDEVPQERHEYVKVIVNQKAIMLILEWNQDYFIVDRNLGNTLEIGRGDWFLSRISGKMSRLKIRYMGAQTLEPERKEREAGSKEQ